MTALLETYTDSLHLSEKGICRVFYRASNSGSVRDASPVQALDVNVFAAAETPVILAELYAIKYLLLYDNVLGLGRSGGDLKISASSGAIRKVQKQKTSNTDLIKHGSFLPVRFSSAKIVVARRFSWVDSFSGSARKIQPGDCLDRPIKTHVGEIHLTRHAVERYMERMGTASLDSAWRNLSKLLTTTQWRSISPTTPMKKGRSRTSESWGLVKNGVDIIKIVIVRSSQTSRIVTILV